MNFINIFLIPFLKNIIFQSSKLLFYLLIHKKVHYIKKRNIFKKEKKYY
jgi:hypothetical protein